MIEDVDPAATLRAVGARIRSIREARPDKMSQEALAHEAGLHRTYVGGVERGERNVAVINLYRLAAALGTTPGDLLP